MLMPIDTVKLAISLDEVLWLWARTPRLQQIAPLLPITEEWFRRFKAEWGLPRSIVEHGNPEAVNVINQSIVAGVFVDGHLNAIDHLSDSLVNAGLSPRNRNQRSLSSKIGFYTNSEHYIPFDTYSRKGLSRLRIENHLVGNPGLDNYETFINCFNEMYESYRDEIDEIYGALHIYQKIQYIGLNPVTSIDTQRFRRKVFDNYLMWIGGIDPYCDRLQNGN